MKTIPFLTLTLLAFSVISCYREQTIPVAIDFTVEVADGNYAVPVTLNIVNLTEGAEWFAWSVDDGQLLKSGQKTPGKLVIETAGRHTISLKAGNQFDQKEKTIEVDLDNCAKVDFDAEVQVNNFAPVTVKLANKTTDGETFSWKFPGAETVSSADENPAPVKYNRPGNYTIRLDVVAGRKTYSLEKQVEVLDSLKAAFDYRVAFADEDMEAPVTVYLENKCTNALSYQWTFGGGDPPQSNEPNPVVVFNLPGVHEISLTADNKKTNETDRINIEALPNLGIQEFRQVKLGIYPARNAIGSFFSFSSGKVFRENELTLQNIKTIDLAYFGFSPDFSMNRFVAPSEMADYGFIPFSTGTSATFYNSIELCLCGFRFSSADFDALTSGTQLANLDLSVLGPTAQKKFNSSQLPRLVPFVLADGRIGLIRVTGIQNAADASYIICDIKVQKEAGK